MVAVEAGIISPVVPRWSLAFLSLLLLLAMVPLAGAQEDPTQVIAHDSSRDGTTREVRSGRYAGDPPGTTDPIAARPLNTYETFEVTVPEGTRHSRLEATIGWNDNRVDLDLSIYRMNAAGRATAPVLARASTKGSDAERATYAPSGTPVEPGRYLVVVDNVCSRNADPRPPGAPNCYSGSEVPDEDDFEGTVTLGNQAPAVTLICPTGVRAKETVTFQAQASDPDGTIGTYLFDMDGDGMYELDSDGSPEVSTTFPTRGPRTLGVQVLDNSSAAAFATCDLTVGRAAPTPDPRPPLTTFKVNRRSFGGRAGRTLVITYRLRWKSRVEVKLRRGDRLVRLIDRGVRKRNRYYRIRLKPAHLRRARYTVRISVQAASGKRQVAQLSARRR